MKGYKCFENKCRGVKNSPKIHSPPPKTQIFEPKLFFTKLYAIKLYITLKFREDLIQDPAQNIF